jgi:hypothetical protein
MASSGAPSAILCPATSTTRRVENSAGSPTGMRFQGLTRDC